MTKPVGKQATDEAIRALDGVRREWLHRDGVTGVDVGYKIVKGEMTDQLAVRVHVRRKVDPELLHKSEVFNVTDEPDAHVGDFPVDVVPASYALEETSIEPAVPGPQAVELEAVSRAGRVPTLVGGISVGNPRATAGTLGAIVWDRRDGSVNILSNFHVLAGIRIARPGEPILQPGALDGGRDSDRVARLNRFRLDRDMDAALARLDGTRPYLRDIIAVPTLTGIAAPRLGMRVVKSGRSTGVTRGLIDGMSFSIPIGYDDGPQTLHDQIHIVPGGGWPAVDYELSRGGDSGSIWIQETTGKAIGLHFAGENDPAPQSEMAVANRMDRVAASLELSVVPLVSRDWASAICARWPWLCDPRIEAAMARLPEWPADLTGLPTVADARVGPPPAPGSGQASELKRTLLEIRAALDAAIARIE